MKISRMFEIVYLLLDKGSLTAKEIADHFEISERTVYRDLDAIAEAEIPIYALKGKNGL